MKALTTILLTLLVLGGCTITSIDKEIFWSDKFYQLKGSSINDVIRKIGTPLEVSRANGSDIYLFKTVNEDYLGRSSICELQLLVSKGIVSKVELTGSEGSCSRLGLK